MDKGNMLRLQRLISYLIHKENIEDGYEKNLICEDKYIFYIPDEMKNSDKSIGSKYISIYEDDKEFSKVKRFLSFMEKEGTLYQVVLVQGTFKIDDKKKYPITSYEVELNYNKECKSIDVKISSLVTIEINDLFLKLGYKDKSCIDKKYMNLNEELIVLRKSKNKLLLDEGKKMLKFIDNSIKKERKITSALRYTFKWNKYENDKEGSCITPYSLNNEENKFILDINKYGSGVLEGISGSGKTYAIISLIIDNMLQGKRILVTSKSSLALMDIEKKIPKNMKPLSIFIGDDNLSEIRDSISKYSSIDGNQYEFYRNAKEAKELMNVKVPLSFIDRIKNKSNGWIEDDLTYKKVCPITNEEMKEFLDILKNNNVDDIELYLGNITIFEEIGTKYELVLKVKSMKKLKDKQKQYIDILNKWNIKEFNSNEIRNTEILAVEYEKELDQFKENFPREFWNKYISDIEFQSNLINNIESSIDLILSTNEKLKLVREKFISSSDNYYRQLKKSKEYISFLKDKYILRKNEDYIVDELYRKTKSLKVVKTIIDDLIEVEKDILVLDKYMEQYFYKYGYEKNEKYTMKTINDIIEVINSCKEIASYQSKGDKILNSMKSVKFIGKLDVLNGDLSRELTKLKIAVDNKRNEIELSAIFKGIMLKIHGNEKFSKLYDGLKNLDEKLVESGFDDLKDIFSIKNVAMKYSYYINRLKSVMPLTLCKILMSSNKENYLDIEEAFYVKKEKGKYIDLVNRLEKIKGKNLIDMYIDNKSKYLMTFCNGKKENTLQWIDALIKIGKGRSKKYYKYIEEAQSLMGKAIEENYLWLVNLKKVREGMDISKTYFDLVIAEGGEALTLKELGLLNLGREIVIVGGDGYKEQYEEDSLLKRVYLDEEDKIMINSSLLEFSKQSLPIKYKFAENYRRNLFMKKIFVGGVREEKKNINIKEADEIIKHIRVQMKKYKKKRYSIGIVSLGGEEQKNYINSRISKCFNKEIDEGLDIFVGDIDDFYLIEKDVIYLSMVIGENRRFLPLNKNKDFFRFSYILTRAKKEIRLFYSVPEDKLNVVCARRMLLNSFQEDDIANLFKCYSYRK
ncbi:AAA domain-containing protein [uncultured Clostridium sp.]|uniref:AAA domain-containing protein n=1 Tax=uncultured Clostridium sp. TaxID=59620 RepID=UPI0025F3BEB9|nr:AAA domain-containing protein [uncultured Clostridium sp.]